MTSGRILPAIFCCLIAAAAFAETPADKDAAYLALVDAATTKPQSAQWCEMREIYPDTSFYRAHNGLGIKKLTMQAGQRMLMDKTKESVAAFRDFLRHNAASASAHFYAAYLYNWNNDLVKQRMEALLPDFGHGVDYIDPAFEKTAANALLDCIVKTGDGRSFGTAYRVVTVEEEEAVVEKYFHVEPVAIDRGRDKGHFFNIVTIEIPEGKVKQDIYFQLDDRLIRGVAGAAKP